MIMIVGHEVAAYIARNNGALLIDTEEVLVKRIIAFVRTAEDGTTEPLFALAIHEGDESEIQADTTKPNQMIFWTYREQITDPSQLPPPPPLEPMVTESWPPADDVQLPPSGSP